MANFESIRSDPEWAEFTPMEQFRMRRNWVAKQIKGRTGAPEEIANFKQQLINDAFQDAPDWQKPMQPINVPFEAVTGVAREVGEGVGGGVMKALRTPQQLVANVLEETMKGITGYDKPKNALEGLVRPFRKTLATTMGRAPETKLSENEFLNTMGEAITDPLSYIGAGIASRLKGAYNPAAFRNLPGVRVIPPQIGGAARGGVKIATKGTPGLMGELGGIPRSLASFNPEQRVSYIKVMAAGKPLIAAAETTEQAVKLRGQLQRVAETAVNASPEQVQAVIKSLESGNQRKLQSVINWAESAAWKRPTLKSGKVKPPTTIGEDIVGNLNEPKKLAAEMEALGD